MGRPSRYTVKLASTICARLAEGQSLRTVCKAKDMPARSRVFEWLATKEEFRDQYARAKAESADAMGEDILDISDDGTNDWMEVHDSEGNCTGYRLNGEHVNRSRLRVDSRKWLMARLQPKKYGDKVQNDISGTIGLADMTDDALDAKLRQYGIEIDGPEDD